MRSVPQAAAPAMMGPVDLDSLLGPGDPGELLRIMAQSCIDCTVKGCTHCRLIGLALGRYQGPRLNAAGPDWVACPLHGVVREPHVCEWGKVWKIVDIET